MTTLADLNPHERDSHISFKEVGHVYTIDGESDYMSVTTWNHSHFGEFDSDRIIRSMMSKPSWERSRYYGKSPEEIKAGWDANRDVAAAAGTKLHYDIECYYNGIPRVNESVEYQYFLNFVQNNSDLVPYRSEWMIWDTGLRFAGSIDMVFMQSDGSVLIYDWKRSKKIQSSGWGEFARTECIEHIPNANFWQYSLQLNTYKALLEKNYGLRVAGMRLVCLHPNQKNYQVMVVPDMSAEVEALFALRLSQLFAA